NGTLSLLKDLFIIRNGLILIKDDIFILKEDKNLQVSKDEVFVNIENTYKKISSNEKARLKKLYKGKSIRPYGYDRENSYGFLIYFPKDHPKITPLQKEYPTLIKYLSSHQKELKLILKNAKEDPTNIYYPRRGASILIRDEKGSQKKVDLEPYYDNKPKIFFPYISDKNVFGFCSNSYYATSDTYFLWPKDNNFYIDYPFWLAYLNSNLVSFLFKAKNVVIKRSKTKLENGLPIPNVLNFQTKTQREIITLIRYLSRQMIDLNTSRNNVLSEQKKTEIMAYLGIHDKIFNEIIDCTEKVNSTFIIKIIDKLFFRLFNLDGKNIDYLINKYYYN
ncbi:MAG: TaqI-like C-terminal specificity domain-containing protein, partial [Candidatus Lokiarchaeota archaeon]